MWRWRRGFFFITSRGSGLEIEVGGFFFGGRLMMLAGLALLMRAVFIVNGGDRIGAFDLVFHFVIAGLQGFGEVGGAPALAGLVGCDGAFDRSGLGDVAGKWIDGSHRSMVYIGQIVAVMKGGGGKKWSEVRWFWGGPKQERWFWEGVEIVRVYQ
jgi:hypothetical protein